VPLLRAWRSRALPIVKECAGALVRWAGLEALARRSYGRGKVGVLVYHDPSPQRLEEHLRFLSSRYSFVSLAQLSAALGGGDWSSMPANAVAVTFDDGHRGNRDLLPLFERFGVRPTIYLCSGIVRGDGRFWFRLPGVDPEPLKLMSPAERERALSASSGDRAAQPGGRHALTTVEVREMAGAVEFGSHTVSHPILPLCSAAESREEIVSSRAQVGEIAGKPCVHLSFPNGDYTRRELEYVLEAGYASSRTTEIGWNGPRTDRFRLKILSLADDASTNVLAAHLAGVLILRRFLPALIHRRRLATRMTETLEA
jgi:peptidoglycan/xylan/chitin deacetylase (PgdA/CDA1 family)